MTPVCAGCGLNQGANMAVCPVCGGSIWNYFVTTGGTASTLNSGHWMNQKLYPPNCANCANCDKAKIRAEQAEEQLQTSRALNSRRRKAIYELRELCDVYLELLLVSYANYDNLSGNIRVRIGKIEDQQRARGAEGKP